MEKVKKIAARPKLRLVKSRHSPGFAVGAVDVVAAPENKPLFTPDAVAYEEDTFLVLSAPLEVREPQKPLSRLATEVREMEPEIPGTVLAKGKSPVRLLAVVHDLNQEPSWQEEWITSALEGIFREVERRKLSSLALPFLGTRHGSLEKERFLWLLRSVLERIVPRSLKRVCLMLPPGTDPKMLGELNASRRGKKESDPQNTRKARGHLRVR